MSTQPPPLTVARALDYAKELGEVAPIYTVLADEVLRQRAELDGLRADKERLQIRLDTVKAMLVSGRLEYGGPLVTADCDPHLFFLYTHNMRLKSGFTFDGAIDAAIKRISVIDAARKEKP